MNKKRVSKRVYVSPAIQVYATEVDFQLMVSSTADGNAGKGGTNPKIGDAKQGWIDDDWEDEEEDETSPNPSQGGGLWE